MNMQNGMVQVWNNATNKKKFAMRKGAQLSGWALVLPMDVNLWHPQMKESWISGLGHMRCRCPWCNTRLSIRQYWNGHKPTRQLQTVGRNGHKPTRQLQTVGWSPRWTKHPSNPKGMCRQELQALQDPFLDCSARWLVSSAEVSHPALPTGWDRHKFWASPDVRIWREASSHLRRKCPTAGGKVVHCKIYSPLSARTPCSKSGLGYRLTFNRSSQFYWFLDVYLGLMGGLIWWITGFNLPWVFGKAG